MRLRVWFLIWMLFNAYVLIDNQLPRLREPRFFSLNPEPDLRCVLCCQPLGRYRNRTYWTWDGSPVHPACYAAYWERRGVPEVGASPWRGPADPIPDSVDY